MNIPELSGSQMNRIRGWLLTGDNIVIVNEFGRFITGENIKTLKDYEWLDSIVISFYVKMLMKRGEVNQETMPKVFGFGTEFWTEYEREDFDYESTQLLTNGFDLFDYDIILVPVYVNDNHWTLAVIYINEDKIVIQYYDSLGGENEELLDQLVEYLREEHLNRKGVPLITTFYRQYYKKQQENDFDCGAIVCSIAESLSRNEKIECQLFREEDMAKFRRVMIYEICSGQMLKRTNRNRKKLSKKSIDQ